MKNFFTESFLEDIVKPNLLLNTLRGSFTGKYRNKKVTKYLYIPIPTIEKHYDSDEYSVGEFDGIIIYYKWINTHIPIGTERIKVPVYKKMKGQTIKWGRYGGLKK